MKAEIEAHNLLWFWQKEPIQLTKFPTKRLKFIRMTIKKNAYNGNLFWNGVHYTGYLEAIQDILSKRQSSFEKKQLIADKAKEEQYFSELLPNLKLNSDTQNKVEQSATEFLGRLDKVFPNSKLSAQIATYNTQPITNPEQSIQADA